MADPRPPLTLLAADPESVAEWRDVLAAAGISADVQTSIDAITRTGGGPLILADGGNDAEWAMSLCRRLEMATGEPQTPLVLFSDDGEARRQALNAGVDIALPRTLGRADFLAQVQSLLRLKERHDQLSLKAAEAQRLNKRLQATYQQIDHELDLARRLQQSFLPQTMPAQSEVKFAVEYRPCGQVGGDFYDVFRLDEHHYGFYVADAMGHGVSAGLLTIFVKKGVRAKDIVGQSYRLVPPDEVLQRLNHDFIEQALSDTPFITMVYGLLNFQTGVLTFSRAGHPYPLYLPREGPAQFWQMEGSLLGVFATQYRLRMQQLRPGDKVILYTDGVDAGAFGERPPGAASLLAAAEQFRELPIDQLLQRLSIDLFGGVKQSDDLTLFGLEIP
jgi:sigma-B regulation protein RsbU (phosphoserine phosphatase)